MKLNDSTRRALRTAYQFVFALIGILPTFALLLPSDSPLVAQIGVVLGWLIVVTKFLNSLEDRGVIPAWLKAPASGGANPVPDDLPVEEPDAAYTGAHTGEARIPAEDPEPLPMDAPEDPDEPSSSEFGDKPPA